MDGAEGMLFKEWCREPDDDPFDESTWVKANPSLVCEPRPGVQLDEVGPDPRKVDTSGVSYAAWVSVADMSASKSSGARRLHQECRLRVL